MVKKLPLILLIFFSLMSLNDLQAQRNNFFHNFLKDSFKLNFNTNPPTVDTIILSNSNGGAIRTATISNKNGEFRFATKTFSRQIQNRFGNVIAGTQPNCFVSFYNHEIYNRYEYFIPHTTDTNIYYLIYSCRDSKDPSNGIDYSQKLYFAEINQSLNNGEGGIVFSDSLLDDSAGLYLAPVYHEDGKSVWIAYQNYKSDTNEMRFLHFKDGNVLTINKRIIENLNSSKINPFFSLQNQFQFNPKGNLFMLYDQNAKIAGQNFINLYYFDNNSGQLNFIRNYKSSSVFNLFNSIMFTPLEDKILNLKHRFVASNQLKNELRIFDYQDPLNFDSIQVYRSISDTLFKNERD